MQLGLVSLADLAPHPATGTPMDAGPRIAEIVRTGVLADEAGLDVFAVGEHHHPGYAVSSPAVVLAAIAARTTSIRLASATTLIGVLDPVRVYEDFATLDLISGGRTEITVGRGAFPEPFELFGHDVDDYDGLFSAHLELLREITARSRVSWTGAHRPPLTDAGIVPRAAQHPLPVWMGVGGNLGSATRAGKLGIPIVVCLGGGPLSRFAETFLAFRSAAREGLPAATAGYLAFAATPAELDGTFAHYAAHATHHSRGQLQPAAGGVRPAAGPERAVARRQRRGGAGQDRAAARAVRARQGAGARGLRRDGVRARRRNGGGAGGRGAAGGPGHDGLRASSTPPSRDGALPAGCAVDPAAHDRPGPRP